MARKPQGLGRMSEDEIDIILKDLPWQPSYSHNLFKRVIKRMYKKLTLEQFFDEFAQYLVVLSRQEKNKT